MKCTYCGAEVQDNCQFCMSCGTKIDRSAREPEHEIPEVVPQTIEKPQERRIVIDPEKFECRPECIDEKITRDFFTSWELFPSDTLTPKLILPTKRSLAKMIFLGLITAGIYPTVIYSRIITELNILASWHDGKRTMPYFGMLMLAPLTLSVYPFVWSHKLCERIGQELQRRSVDYKFGPAQFWLWNVLGSFILVGPFVFTHKLMKSMNLLNKDFNERG